MKNYWVTWEAGRFARCPVRPESFRPESFCLDWESIRKEYMKSFRPNLFLLYLRIKRIKSSSRFFLIDLMTNLTQINRRKRCVNILRCKKGAAPTKVRAKLLHTPGEQDIGWNDRNSVTCIFGTIKNHDSPQTYKCHWITSNCKLWLWGEGWVLYNRYSQHLGLPPSPQNPQLSTVFQVYLQQYPISMLVLISSLQITRWAIHYMPEISEISVGNK